MTVTTEEAAEIAGVTTAVIRQWVVRGDLEPVRRGARQLRFHYDDVARVQADKRPRAWRQQHADAREAWIASEIPRCLSR